VPLKPGAFKTYPTPDQSFWCCVGTGMENHAKYPDSIYVHDDASLYVNLFIASAVRWREKAAVVRQETRFPDSDTMRLTVRVEHPVRFMLKVRYPGWAASGMDVRVNGRETTAARLSGAYVAIDREWRDGDLIDLRIPMHLRFEFLPGEPAVAAVLYGPIVLAGDLGSDGLTPSVRYGPSVPPLGKLRTPAIPAFVGDPARMLGSIESVPGRPLTFRTKGLAQPHDVTLVPFFKASDQRYTVYWKLFAPAQWAERKAEVAAPETMYHDPTEVFDITYAMPEGLLKGRSRVAMKFQAAAGASTGGVFDVRTVKTPAR